MHFTDSLCYTPQNEYNIVNQLYSNKIIFKKVKERNFIKFLECLYFSPCFLILHIIFFFFYLGDEQQQLDKRKERNVKRELGSSSSLHEAGCGNQPSSRASVCQFLQCLHDGYTSLGSVLLGNFCFISDPAFLQYRERG